MCREIQHNNLELCKIYYCYTEYEICVCWGKNAMLLAIAYTDQLKNWTSE